MTDLLNIAKECGAYSFDPTGTFTSVDTLVFTPAQLHATVEKVCGPLLIALETADIWIDTLPVPTTSATRMGILVTQALTEYRKSMGQDK